MKNTFLVLSIVVLSVLSCKTKPLNYITYYNKVNAIDSVLRYQQDTLYAIKHYKKLFRKYPPKNQERILELETYIKLADKKNKNFGGKKTLLKLLPLVAPYWKYRKQESNFISLYKKHGFNEVEIETEISNWKSKLNRRLIDSFSVAKQRDQMYRESNNSSEYTKMDKKNAKLLLWTLDNYGYPSLDKIGLEGNNDVFLSMSAILIHMGGVAEYDTLKTKLIKYIESGDLPPLDYIGMVDKHNKINKIASEYKYYDNETFVDTIRIDASRRKIGLPSIKHAFKTYKAIFNK